VKATKLKIEQLVDVRNEKEEEDDDDDVVDVIRIAKGMRSETSRNNLFSGSHH